MLKAPTPSPGLTLPLARALIDCFYRMGNRTNRGNDRRVSAAIADDLEIWARPLHKMTGKDTEILGSSVGVLFDSETGLGETREEGGIFLT